MLSIEESRKELGKLADNMSDEEVIKIRNELYELANIALDSYFESKSKNSEID